MKIRVAFKTQEGKKEILQAYDSFMQKWVSPYEELYIDTGYGKTYIIASGEKGNPPLILLHGTGMNSIMWLGETKEYSKNYRVYAVDIPGEPGKSDEAQLPLEGVCYAEWLFDVLNALSIEKANIVGISLGAWLAVKFSINYPEKLNRLVLIAPSGIGPQRKSFLFIALCYGVLGEKGIEKLYCKVNGDNPLPEEMLKYQKLIRNNFNYRSGVIPIFSDSELEKLIMPTSLFVGEKDIMLHSMKTAKRLHDLQPHAIINVLPEAGHSIVNLSGKIKDFLSGAQ